MANGESRHASNGPSVVFVVDASGQLAEEIRALVNRLAEAGEPQAVHTNSAAARERRGPPRETQRPLLTRRERDVLRMAALGRSNSEIARELWLSQDTIRFHLRNAYRKLGVHNRVDAIAAAHMDDAPAPPH